jgi:hypothetical protein
MKVSRILCSIALVGLSLGLSAAVAHADGADPKLKMGGGTGSPDCFGPGNVSFQGNTGSTGTFSTSCKNNGTTDITSFSFQIQDFNAPGGITPSLDNLLAPFASGNPLNWTLDTNDNGQCPDIGGIIICTATQSSIVMKGESAFCALSGFSASICSQASSLTASQLENLAPGLFKQFGGNPCADALVYVAFGVIPGCDLNVGTVDGGGAFAANVVFDTAPAGSTPAPLPEPGSLSMLLAGLTGLPFLRRKLSRS